MNRINSLSKITHFLFLRLNLSKITYPPEDKVRSWKKRSYHSKTNLVKGRFLALWETVGASLLLMDRGIFHSPQYFKKLFQQVAGI